MRKVNWSDISHLRKVIESSEDKHEVLIKLGLVVCGSSYRKLNSIIKENSITISHFLLPNTKVRRYNAVRRLPNEKVFVENSTYPRHKLKARILKENILVYECLKCKNDGQWRGEQISLQLEHKNGMNNDNRKENLCFLCPNCHSQTSTYAGKNKRGIV